MAGGIALLAFLGSSQKSDVGAHFFGFLCGTALGGASRVHADASKVGRKRRSLWAPTLPAAACLVARHQRLACGRACVPDQTDPSDPTDRSYFNAVSLGPSRRIATSSSALAAFLKRAPERPADAPLASVHVA